MKKIVALLALLLLPGCAWYAAQWADDGSCVARCARQLGLQPVNVLATRSPDGCYCVPNDHEPGVRLP